MWGKNLDSNRRSRRHRLGPVAVLLSIVTLLSVVAPYGIAISGPVDIASAAEPTSVPADGNITVSGHYALDGDYSGAIEITADDVVLDGRGHWVNGTDSAGIGVTVTGGANVTVRNLSAYNWGTAIIYDSVTGGPVDDVSLRGTNPKPVEQYGVHVFNSAGGEEADETTSTPAATPTPTSTPTPTETPTAPRPTTDADTTSTATSPGTTTVGPGLHGFGPVVGLVAILVAVIVGRRRRG